VIVAVFGAFVVIACVWVFPYFKPLSYREEIEQAAEPCIAAIEAYTQRVGHPPATLDDLLPEFDASSNGTGFPRQREFWYAVPIVPGKPPSGPWYLSVSLSLFSPKSDLLQYESYSRSWRVVHRGRDHPVRRSK
jgi:hypothetical protein